MIEHTDYDVRYGLWVDIFPLDFAGSTREEGFQNLKWIQNRCGRIVSSGMPLKGLSTKKKCGRLVWRMVFLLLGRKRMFEKYVDQLRAKNNQSVMISSFGELKEKEVFPAEWFKESEKYMFCGKEFTSIAKYDEFLNQFYGDYMTLPPEEERVWHPMEAYVNTENR